MINYTDLIGAPFRDGGRGENGEYDCWGLALEIFRRAGYPKLPDYRISCYDSDSIDERLNAHRQEWVKIEQPQEPCLVTIRFNEVIFINHCAVYIGNGLMIHTRERTGAVVERIDSPMWKRRIEGFYILRGVGGK